MPHYEMGLPTILTEDRKKGKGERGKGEEGREREEEEWR
jgi:hypothetical protein